ncbi:MAG: dTDP-4-dehydrorhamnose 3,5-epimerase [Desulforudis sp.]|jgi:dTDP-4-dehydrorhamnose 3,5-epimerase|nr:MAG: dTDP-4-dehydrorhamnose 3,5-epimerase [Desulforudis sp.]
MKFIPSFIPGCFEIQPTVLEDQRGLFVKTFHEQIFAQYGLETHFAEEYYSKSYQGVLRGLHFQVPPHDHAKLVYCLVGQVKDVVVDLRLGSPTYGKFASFILSAEKASMVYIPRGLAHGFYTLSDSATMVYKVTSVYSPPHDTGIRWDSVGIDWPSDNPIISERDRQFETFAAFNSPFRF